MALTPGTLQQPYFAGQGMQGGNAAWQNWYGQIPFMQNWGGMFGWNQQYQQGWNAAWQTSYGQMTSMQNGGGMSGWNQQYQQGGNAAWQNWYGGGMFGWNQQYQQEVSTGEQDCSEVLGRREDPERYCKDCSEVLGRREDPERYCKDCSEVLGRPEDPERYCKDCSNDSKTMVTCDDCGVYVCETFCKARAINMSTRNIKTCTFEDIKARWSTRPERVNRGANKVDPAELLKKNLDMVSLKMKNPCCIEVSINGNEIRATHLIIKRFDELMQGLQHRRGIILSQKEAKTSKERKSIRRTLASHKVWQDKLKSAFTSGQSAECILLGTAEDVEAERMGVVYRRQLLSTIRSAGQVRLVTSSLIQRPSYVSEDAVYNAVKFTPDDFFFEASHLLTSSASADVQISAGVVSNIRPDLDLRTWDADSRQEGTFSETPSSKERSACVLDQI